MKETKLQKSKSKATLQVVSIPRSNGQVKTNGLANKVTHFPVPENATRLDGVRSKIFLDRYSWKDEQGIPTEEVPEQMWARVAREIAKVEKTDALKKHWEERFYHALSDFKFLPGGRILSAAGTGYEVTYYNCFVIPSPKDSRGGIIDNLKVMMEIMSRAGGVGINLSSLRPSGARVHKVNGTSSGPVSWASLYSTGTHDVIQQGGSRRGALMLMLNDWHPDVEQFIEVKQDLSKINGANLSICASDSFMEAVQNDADWTLRFPDTKHPKYDIEWDGDILEWEAKGYPTKVYKTVKAKEIWDKICQAAWRSAEPGLVFMERYNKWSNTWYFEKIICVNPCGEQGLGAWSVCNLGALNLAAFVEDGQMNYEKLAEHASIATRFLDNVVDANYYFYEENEKAQKSIRRTGLGTMGLGDALIKMKLRYGVDSVDTIEKIYKTIRDAAYESSSDIAKEKGSFPAFNAKLYSQGHFIKQLPDNIRAKIAKQGMRNAVVLTQAPTGTTSLLAGVSSGIEPVYDFAFVRRDRTGESIMYHPMFKEWKDANPEGATPPAYFVSANDLTPDDHVLVQAMIQKYTDSSISKTVNAPNSHTVEQVEKLYMDAYKLGCKGVTYMRDGSRDGVLTHMTDKKEEIVSADDAPVAERPMILRGRTYKISTPVGEAFITINRDEQDMPFEVFVTVGRGGMHTMADAEAMGRLVSLSLRLARGTKQTDPKAVAEKIVGQLRGIGGASHVGFGKNRIMSLGDAIAKVLAEDLAQSPIMQETQETLPLNLTESNVNTGIDDVVMSASARSHADLCPECGSASFVTEEGCKKCHACGYSMC